MKKILFTILLLQCSVEAHAKSDTEIGSKSGSIHVAADVIGKLGCMVDIDENYINITNDYGELVRLEVIHVSEKLIADSMPDQKSCGLQRYIFDSGYLPFTYKKIKTGYTEISRTVLSYKGKNILSVWLDLPSGSVLVVDGRRLDAKRNILIFVENNSCTFLTTEINNRTSDIINAKTLEAQETRALGIIDKISIR